MIECEELAGKVIRASTIYEDRNNGPEVLIEFTDDTTFSVRLRIFASIDAKRIKDEGGRTPSAQGLHQIPRYALKNSNKQI